MNVVKPKLELAIVVIAGFSQKLGEAVGMSALYWMLREKYSTSPRNFVIEQTWDGDMEQLARKLARNCARHHRSGTPKLKLVVVAYSWGAGRGLTMLAKHLQKLGMWIDFAFLVDAVPKRPGWFLSPRQLYALTRIGKFRVPPNVRVARAWRTLNKRKWSTPVGREILPANTESPETVFVTDTPKDRKGWKIIVDPLVFHDTIDGDQRVHEGILQAMKATVSV